MKKYLLLILIRPLISYLRIQISMDLYPKTVANVSGTSNSFSSYDSVVTHPKNTTKKIIGKIRYSQSHINKSLQRLITHEKNYPSINSII
ncbi:hypothetical protein [Aquimarina pacifica]|uniref:hypothetical protein n=1 Tax=Aquimarina pacifica TaxID=1296415 RepID=UPI0012693A9C|nr:hypothetical protein [Aquimarina pacifica]